MMLNVTEPTTTRSPRPRRSWRRRLVVWSGSVVALAVALVLGVVGWVQWSPQSKIFNADEVPSRPVALVLGAGLQPDGSPSLYLARRLDIARDLYERDRVQAILVSGDNSTPWHDEPTAMRDWLVDNGVPDDAIVLDHAGLNTHDSCVRANEIFGVTEATVITQDYHLPRALFSCKHAGIDAVGVGASAANGDIAKYRTREFGASLKAAWDALTSREPKHLGPRETALDEALENATLNDPVEGCRLIDCD